MNTEIVIWSKRQLCIELNNVGRHFDQGYGLPVSFINKLPSYIEIVMLDNHIINGEYSKGSDEPLLLITPSLINLQSKVVFPLFLYIQKHSKSIILTYSGEFI